MSLRTHRLLRHRGEVTKELRREGDAGRFWHAAAVNRHLQLGAALLGVEVLPVNLREALAGDEPQPEEERQIALLRELGQLTRELDEGVLKHVGRVDTTLQERVEPERHHRAQSRAVVGEGRR